MDSTTYNNLVQFLEQQQLPINATDKQKQQLINQAKHYVANNSILYKRNRKVGEKLLRVIRVTKLETILYNMHADITAGHFAFDGTYQRTIARYYWPGMGDDIKNYINACETCQWFKGKKQKEYLYPIHMDEPFE